MGSWTHMVSHHHLESPDAGFHNPLIQAGEQPYEVGHTAACNHSAQAIFNAISQAAHCRCTVDTDQALGLGVGQELYQPRLPLPVSDKLASYSYCQ